MRGFSMSCHAPGFAGVPVRVLLIDEDANDRDLFAHHARIWADEIEVDEAECVEDARRQIELAGRVPDLIFVDLRLPGAPAVDFIRWIRAQPQFAKVLVIAVSGDLTHACAGPVEYGVHALLMKPIASDDVRALLMLARATRASAMAEGNQAADCRNGRRG
jgi:CheY-like chemotaxis protein